MVLCLTRIDLPITGKDFPSVYEPVNWRYIGLWDSKSHFDLGWGRHVGLSRDRFFMKQSAISNEDWSWDCCLRVSGDCIFSCSSTGGAKLKFTGADDDVIGEEEVSCWCCGRSFLLTFSFLEICRTIIISLDFPRWFFLWFFLRLRELSPPHIFGIAQ